MQSEGYSFAIDGVVMRVVILGSGVVGVTSWYLSQGGHDDRIRRRCLMYC